MVKVSFAGKREPTQVKFKLSAYPIRDTYNACATRLTYSNDTVLGLHKTATGKDRFLAGLKGCIKPCPKSSTESFACCVLPSVLCGDISFKIAFTLI